MNEKKYTREFARMPSVKRYMNLVVETFGYNVGMFNSLAAKYYATLQGFEIMSLDKRQMPEDQMLKYIEDGDIDKVTEQDFRLELEKREIKIPAVLMEYGQIAANIVNIGRIEYMKKDMERYKKGLSPLIEVVVRGFKSSENIVNRVLERRNYILDHKDDQEHFFGKKARERRQERREKRHVRKLEKRQQKSDNKILKARERNAGRLERKALATTSKISGRSSGASEVLGAIGESNIIGQVGNLTSSLVGGGGVQAQTGGLLGSIFAGGGAVPTMSDPERFSGVGNEGARAISNAENDGKDKPLFQDGIGTKEMLVLGGVGLLAVVLIKVL